MNLNRPVLVGWQAGKTAHFIRRHRWFFAGTIPYGSFFMTLCVYVPIAAAILMLRGVIRGHAVLVIGFLIVMLAYLLTSFILVEAALEGRSE